MSITIPAYIEGDLSGQYSGSKENDHSLIKNRLALLKKAKKYSVTLYKDLHIDKAVIISEQQYEEVKNAETWWKINHTAEAAIDFLYPFFEKFTFLRHLPIELYVERPSIKFTDKKDQRNATYGILCARVSAKLTIPLTKAKSPTLPLPPTPTPHPQPGPDEPPPIPTNSGCFNNNDSYNGCFGLKDGVSGTGGCYGLTGGSNGLSGCFSPYGNPIGCFSAPMSSGCFPNMGLGCLIPSVLFFLLLFSLFKSCSHISTLTPIVNTIKKDRDDSRISPPVWVPNPDDTTQPEPDYVPTSDSLLKVDSLKPTIDTVEIIDTIPKINKGSMQLMLWDWDIEDKDTVSVFLNNKLIIDNLRLRKKPYFLNEKGLKYGENYLEVVAMNTDKGSNTVAIMGYSDRSKLCDTTLKLKSSQSTRLTLIYQ